MSDIWQDEAACKGVDPNVFVTPRGGPVTEALTYCDRCPVVEECLEVALADPLIFGVWGGMSRRQRKIERKRRGILGLRGRRQDSAS